MWQTIESAPIDGTEILAARQHTARYWERVAVFFSKPCGSWVLVGIEEEAEEQEDTPFTHWMPLPAPPEASGKEG